jgi:hypothetical protein
LINTYRLTEKSAAQTGVFYDNSLISKSSEKGIVLKGNYSNIFCPNGGSSLLFFDNMDEGKIPGNAVDFIIKLVKAIREEYPQKEVAVLAAFRETVNSIIDNMLNVRMSFNNLEVNTVDRIQGMTVDISIYLAPSYKTKFSFDDNRFNVATSRAKKGTLIITEDLITNKKLISKKVSEFLNNTHKASIN